uniref:Venom peptide n=1 Tax=Angiostrongylus cantonensis TaxID=6313 RepID=A0A0K0D1P8_ANGCA
MMKWTTFAVFIFACIFSAFVWADAIDDANIDQVMARIYRAVLLKSKRSPSMGLSLAEYMASPQGGDNFHFIPSGRK